MTPDERAEALVAVSDTPVRVQRQGQPDVWSTPRERWQRRVDVFDALVSAGAPLRELQAAWAYDLEPCIALTAGMSWSRHGNTGIMVLAGPVGRGKTVAAARYALACNAAWCHAPLLALNEWSKADKRIEGLLAARHLVIDEVGGPGTTSGMAVARISALLTSRHASGRPTLLTTNLSEGEFAKVYDGSSATESRLIDRVGGGGSWVSCERAKQTGPRVNASFRATGGCDYARNRYADAKRSLALLVAAESGDTRDLVLDELQDALGCDDVALEETFGRVQSQRDELADTIANLVESSSFGRTRTEAR